MKFLLDENFPKAVIPLPEALDHSVLDFREIGAEGASDRIVIQAAIDNSAEILTTDRDFFHTLGRNTPEHFGIVVVALKRPTRDSIIRRVEWFIESGLLESPPGRTFQFRDRAWMVYPPIDT